jgi:DNA-binding transcriptional LysR family regulator
MVGHEINRSGEMEVFTRVVELGGFSPAARASRLTPSAVSKLVARLEARLGARLLTRSTRKLQLTPEGTAFYDRAVRILADLADAERSVATAEAATGRIRVNTSASYANHILARILPGFIARYPAVTLDLVLTDAIVDLVADRTDVAIRAGPMKSSSLTARKLGDTPMQIVASPAYLAKFGTPRSVKDLDGHNRLGFAYVRSVDGWLLRGDRGALVTVPASGHVQASDGEALRQLVLNGVGMARLAGFVLRNDIAAGRLVTVLDDINAHENEAFHAVYIGQGGPLPARVRALLDYLAEFGRVS